MALHIDRGATKYTASLHIYPVDFGAVFLTSGSLPLPKRVPQRQVAGSNSLACRSLKPRNT